MASTLAGRPVVTTAAPNGPVMLWADTFTNAFSPEVGQAAVAVLEDAGYEVRLTEGNVCCGLTWISTGQLDGARRQLSRSLDALAPGLVFELTELGVAEAEHVGHGPEGTPLRCAPTLTS